MKHSDERNEKAVLLLLKEAGLCATCIEQGLTSLRKASLVRKWNYYQAFFLLSIGIERLLKIIVITISRVEENKLPTNTQLKAYGHDIVALYKKVSGHIRPDDEFYNSDKIYDILMHFLSEFAQISRYYNLDSITGIEKTDDPLFKWKEIQLGIENRHCYTGKISERQKEFTDKLDQVFFFRVSTEKDVIISDAENYLLETRNLDKVQGYSVYYFHQLISQMVSLLNEISNKKNQLPYLNEFFPLFNNSMTIKEVISRKNWNFLSTSR